MTPGRDFFILKDDLVIVLAMHFGEGAYVWLYIEFSKIYYFGPNQHTSVEANICPVLLWPS